MHLRVIDSPWWVHEYVWVLSHVWLFAALWVVVRQAPLSMRFPRQEYRSWLPFPTLGDLPDPGSNPALVSPALASGFFTASASWEAHIWGTRHLTCIILFTVHNTPMKAALELPWQFHCPLHSPYPPLQARTIWKCQEGIHPLPACRGSTAPGGFLEEM